ncbi:MAG: hypothetical protein COW03_17350 [Cytophagales bacterium CG12_big_fil_rev_8_21_14_0_65_40_12]|nr:MAG: hypothetical protein COW03_17350 [Cytophagales bacterium CG12_big_fil_rev_8_21_14_0_65_40_12]PIW02973.1 MAG: hypothetical protein COW40_16615 [Cytophagales bacterium CG17_big_fil_post_rev_8_21_14_2_50_40_13]
MQHSFFDFFNLSFESQIKRLYREGDFIVAIRYYGYKINLYLLDDYYLEVFYNHKLDKIEKIELLDFAHSRMKFYADQIALPSFAKANS